MSLRFLVLALFISMFTHAETRAAEPIVHLLVPGFTVQELPLQLSNINNLRFAPDGQLFALGYDGRIHLLRDTDNDGLEDKAEVYWDKTTLSVPVGMTLAPEGVYVSSHGKVSLLRDTDGDGAADVEDIVASGWPPTDVGSGGVDATSVTRDAEGNLYFGLLVADYSNAYRLKKRKDLKPEEQRWLQEHGDAGGRADEQVSLYDIGSKRGTIQKWHKRTRQLETIATGIRVPYHLAFNRHGDLFLTDQEGETWMPNGNPLDELNHIVPGRNYGFPPRHDKWLPNLISDPPVVAFGPQHQSACGFFFNESGPQQKCFGPAAWEGDAFVAGESRGKIWRVRLVKTPNGYVGRPFLLARLGMLTTDVALSPRGELYVSCHSGPPDWGTGPQGAGKIFKISYSDQSAPQPSGIWAAGPTEVHIAFDRPLANSSTNGLAGAEIEFGEYVRAADRFEVLKPPYQVVKNQEATPRGKLRIRKAWLSANKRTIELLTEPHREPVYYALTLPAVSSADGRAPQSPVDLAYNLNGVEARWSGPDREPDWKGWVPHLDPEVNRGLLSGSATHAELFRKLSQPGTLELKTQLSLPRGAVTLRLESNVPFELGPLGERLRPKKEGLAPARGEVGRAEPYDPWLRAQRSGEVFSLSVNFTNTFERRPWPLAVRMETGALDSPSLRVSYAIASDATLRPFSLNSFQPPWVPKRVATPPVELPKMLVAGGDYERGRDLYFSEGLKCATCHRLRGEGKEIGPDLSNLAHRDAASVLRDIKEPSAAINPDHVAYNVATSDGLEVSGFIRDQTDQGIRLLAADGKEAVIKRADIRELRASSVSLMPAGLIDSLKEGQVLDLLTFLLHEPPKRSSEEVHAFLSSAATSSTPTGGKTGDTALARLEVVLVASKQDHGPGQHDYPAWQKTWSALLNGLPGVSANTAWEWPDADQFQTARVIVFYYWNHDWSAARLAQLDAYLARGGGVLLLHSATIEDKDPEKLAARFGLAAQPQRTKYLHTPLELRITSPQASAITRGLPERIAFLDEPYWPMIGDTNKIQVLATCEVESRTWPMMWTFQNGPGRVFASILGHYTWTLDDPLFRLIILRAVGWVAGEAEHRLETGAVVEAMKR